MTTEIATPPFVLDVRVATSPLVGLRYGLDGRATELDAVVEQVRLAEAEAEAERAAVLARLTPYEAAGRLLARRLSRSGMAEARDRLDEALQLRAELSRLDERIEGLRRRGEALGAQRRTMREISSAVAQATELHAASIDGPGAAENQAVRHLYGLIGADHEATALEILEGPMQLLADATLHTELVGRVIEADPAAAAEGLQRCRAGTGAAAAALNRIVYRIHPDSLDEDGLQPAIRTLLADLGPAVSGRLVVLGVARRVRRAIEVGLFRIVQDAVGNALRHGRASSVEVVLFFQPDRLSALIRDDGEGFDVAATEARLGRRRGLGLIAMRQRAQAEGGQLEIRSVVGEGTEVRASFPLGDEADARPGGARRPAS
ncbi:MAG: sensor histidine kinase [Candidatus Dormibacteria bacterium]